jgi:hypothetical protein
MKLEPLPARRQSKFENPWFPKCRFYVRSAAVQSRNIGGPAITACTVRCQSKTTRFRNSESAISTRAHRRLRNTA